MRPHATVVFLSLLALTPLGCGGGGGSAPPPPPPPTPPAAPGSLRAQVPEPTRVLLAWDDAATDEDGYRIERRDPGGTFAQVGEVAANVSVFEDAGVMERTTYRYRVRAFNAVGASVYSNAVDVTTPGNNRAPQIQMLFGAFGTAANAVVEIEASNQGSLTVQAVDPDGDPMTWTVAEAGGRESGREAGVLFPATASGADVVLDLRAVVPGRNTVLHLEVVDDRGARDELLLSVYRIAVAQPSVVGVPTLRDTSADGVVGAGDELVVRFDRPMELASSATPDDFVVVPAGPNAPPPSFGSGASLLAGPAADEIRVVLGVAPLLKARQVYRALGGEYGAHGLDVGAGQTGIRSVNAQRTARPRQTQDLYAGFSFTGLDGSVAATQALLLHDLDRDAGTDLVTATAADGVLVQRDVGRPWAATAQLGSGDVRAVAVGDLDRDGLADLVAAHRGNDQIEIWRNGAFGFQAQPAATLASPGAGAVAVGDLTGNGWLDIVVGGEAGTPTTVWVGLGGGSFATQAVSVGGPSIADATRTVAIADLDRDGRLDLVTGNAAGAPSRAWLQDGVAGWTDVALTEGSGLGALDGDTVTVAVADLDGDGLPDIAEANRGQPNRFWRNAGGRGFAAQALGGGALPTSSLALGDLDLDGRCDVVEGFDSAPGRVWLNRGFFRDNGERLVDGLVALGPLTGDGDVDLVVGRAAGNALFLGTVSSAWGRFVVEQAPNGAGQDADAIALGDVDRDGLVDAVYVEAAPAGAGSLRVATNDPTAPGSFTVVASAALAPDLADVVLADLDGDAQLDAVVGLSGGGADAGFAVVRGPLLPALAPATEHRFGSLRGATQVVRVGDLDGDGAPDVVLGTAAGLAVAHNDGGGSFGGAVLLSLDAILDVELGDMDRDGDLDLVTGTAQSFQVWTNDGAGSLLPRSYSGVLSAAVELADADGDGGVDVFVAQPGRDRVEIWLNDRAGQLLAPAASLMSGSAFDGLAVRDLDGDGIPDAAATVSSTRELEVFSTRDGLQAVTLSCGGVALDPQAGDVDGDGDPDLVAASGGGSGCPNWVVRNL